MVHRRTLQRRTSPFRAVKILQTENLGKREAPKMPFLANLAFSLLRVHNLQWLSYRVEPLSRGR
jgi:hypothetical protein